MIRFNALPSLDGRSVSQALDVNADTPLARAVATAAAAHPGLSGVHALTDGRGAFAARVHLARAATRTLDLQYYIWKADLSGNLLFDEVLNAADRGVRVRMLLDDNTTSGLDPILADLDEHSNIEVRLFNPFVIRKARVIGFLTDFSRVNRRMHNKAWIADNQAAVVGGRNIGDEYFHAGQAAAYADLDLLAIGPAIGDLSRSFDAFWACESAYPVATILPQDIEPASIADDARATVRTTKGNDYLRAVAQTDDARALLSDSVAFDWVPTRLVVDDPAKGLGDVRDDALLWTELIRLLGEPRRELGLVSPFFVPTREGVDAFVRMARKGVRVRIVTNAFEAADEPVAHSGYARWRAELLRAGVELYEMRAPHGQDKVGHNLTSSGSSGSGARGAGSALHAKTVAVDGERIFIGSFNFDPRSRHLNTEQGFVVESTALATSFDEFFADFAPNNTYRVELSGKGKLCWRERVGDRDFVHEVEPGTTVWQRAAVGALSHLPIDWLL